MGERTQAIAAGGIGAVHLLAQKIGLVDLINQRVPILKRHLPYHESDHVLNMAYNLLAGGTCLEHLELRRQDEAYLDALETDRIPDPTTAGDFCRRFTPHHIDALLDAANEARLNVWKQQPETFFEEAFIEADGTMVETYGQCKQGTDFNHKKQFGYHPLLVSLGNTNEVLYVKNRSGNRPSHEGAAAYFDKAVALCRQAGFRKITLRGDTDFSQTAHLDHWNDDGVRFVFGYAAYSNLVEKAEQLPSDAWKRFSRRPKKPIKTRPRQKPENVKQQKVKEREYENIELVEEWVAEFSYQPTNCKTTYRMIVLYKRQRVNRGQQYLLDKEPYFFYISNDWDSPPEQIVYESNDRCRQENLIGQQKLEVGSFTAPLDGLVSNGAYMAICSLAWSLKIWAGLLLPEDGRWKEKRRQEKTQVLKMHFHTFTQAFIQMPCQILRSGRRLIYRLLNWNPWQEVFFRLLDVLGRLQC